MNSRALLLAAAAASLAPAALAQTPQLLPLHKTADLLVTDNQTLNLGILRAHDANVDGDYNDPGELTVYFDPAVAINPSTGLPYASAAGIFGNPNTLTIDKRGSVFVICNTTSSLRTLIRVRDLDGDGDVNDAGESNIYFDATNLSGLSGYSMQGMCFDDQDRLWITASGQGTTTIDRVFVATDLNQDGDVNDAGEVLVAYDRITSVGAGSPSLDSPAWIGTLPDGTLYLSNGFSSNQGLFRLAETGAPNGNFNDAGEVTGIYNGLNGNPGPNFVWCARFRADGKLVIYNQTAKRLIVATDANQNGVFDDAGEAAPFFTTSDNGLTIGAGFAFDVREDGVVAFGDTGSPPNNRVLFFRDLNNDGDASDAGEQTVAIDFPATAFPGVRPRALLFLPLEPSQFGIGCLGSSGFAPLLSWDRDTAALPYPGNASFGLQLSLAPAGVTVLSFYSEVVAPVQVNSLAPGLADPNCFLYPSLLDASSSFLDPGSPTDGLGNLAIPAPLPPSPFLAGKTFAVQVLTVDFALALPLITSNAISVPIL